MSGGLRNVKKDQFLFHEGDVSDAMFVIKSGRIAITKSKGSSDVVLAELGPGDMLGEMAFFDNRARSAGAKAIADAVVIELPFKALNAQFKTFPEWLKAVVRSVNNHLRNANQKIKNLEKSSLEEEEYFSPHLITKLFAVLGLVASRYGVTTPLGLEVPAGTLRRYTIQIFQLPTAKMQKLMELLEALKYMKVEDMGEGRTRITVFKLDFILAFAEFYNEWLFKSEDKRILLVEKDLPPLKALLHYGSKETPDAKGDVRVNLTDMQAGSVAEIGAPFSIDDVNGLVESKLTTVKMSTDKGITLGFNFAELATLYPYWQLIYTFKKIVREH